jgi:hypothetical protein
LFGPRLARTIILLFERSCKYRMKKMSFVLTLTVLAALLLAACGGGGAAEGTPVPGTDLTEAVPGLETPAPDLGTDLTPTVGGGLGTDLTPTVAGTVELGTTPEVATTPETTATPEAGTGTGANMFVLLSDLIKMQVAGQDGAALGSIAGVVVSRPIPTTGGDTGGELETTGTPEAGMTPEATATLSADTGSDTMDDTAAMSGPFVAYLIINKSAGSTGTGDTGGTDTTATPEATDAMTTATPDAGSGDTGGTGDTTGTGAEVLVPWAAVSTDMAQSGTTAPTELTLTIDAEALANAPTFSSAMDTSVAQAGWDTSINTYWTGLGLTIPVTGAGEVSSIVLRSPFQEMSLVDDAGTSFGAVTDYVVDLNTGEIVYAVLTGAETNEGKFFLVPFSHLTWGGTGQAAGGLNSMTFSGTDTVLSGAPSYTSVEEIDLTNLSEIESYWMTQ